MLLAKSAGEYLYQLLILSQEIMIYTHRLSSMIILIVSMSFLLFFMFPSQKHDAYALSFVKSFGSQGSGNGQFSGPLGIAIDSSGNIYVADSKNNRLEKFLNSSVQVPVPCSVPSSGDWTLSSSCTLQNTSTAPANVIVQTNSILTIPNGVSLHLDFKSQHLIVKSGSGVLIKAGGKSD